MNNQEMENDIKNGLVLGFDRKAILSKCQLFIAGTSRANFASNT